MPDADIIADLRSQISAIESGASSSFGGAGRASGVAKGRKRQCQGEPDAFKKIVALVNASDRSEKGIRERLVKEGFAEPEVDDAVERAKDYGLIDDARYAAVLIRSRVSQGKGSAGVERELLDNGIDPQEVPGWPYEYYPGEDFELDRALQALERKPPRSKNLREGAFRRLVQRGYPISVASRAARMWSEQQLGSRP